ncbi:c-type cytochrome [Marinobacterium arenosum]|uniref:c-type cytochrome n=1 Tax=Marinobacterium arenosum TaxID=2862496 RepID=UPI001C9720AB|nr:cytochrome c [Marinobacterium arenosum]MBY4677700.1 cytochrome c [Marinobacterium arenosum]
MAARYRGVGLMLAASLLAGCGEEKAEVAEVASQSALSGKALFHQHCASCHKEQGTGQFLEGIPPNVLTRLTKEQVVTLILYGDPAKPEMPIFEQLTEEQAKRIADHLWWLKDARLKL